MGELRECKLRIFADAEKCHVGCFASASVLYLANEYVVGWPDEAPARVLVALPVLGAWSVPVVATSKAAWLAEPQ
jgi:hypothetical protein